MSVLAVQNANLHAPLRPADLAHPHHGRPTTPQSSFRSVQPQPYVCLSSLFHHNYFLSTFIYLPYVITPSIVIDLIFAFCAGSVCSSIANVVIYVIWQFKAALYTGSAHTSPLCTCQSRSQRPLQHSMDQVCRWAILSRGMNMRHVSMLCH